MSWTAIFKYLAIGVISLLFDLGDSVSDVIVDSFCYFDFEELNFSCSHLITRRFGIIFNKAGSLIEELRDTEQQHTTSSYRNEEFSTTT
jgi:hypothetical protein